MKYNIEATKLSNGLTVATDHMSDVESAVLYLTVKTGSRNENDKNNGISHFLEHMAFKGTEKRSYRAIFEEIHAVGGHMNAGTGYEVTAYYIKVLKDDIELAMDILSDIIQNSVFAQEEVEKERGVILQELASSLDTPDDVIFNYFHNAAYGLGTPLGRTILGPAECISSMNRNNFIAYMSEHYHAGNMVLGFSGDVEHKKIVELANKYFTKLSSAPVAASEKALYRGGSKIVNNPDLKQVQFALGFRSHPYFNREKSIPLAVISKIVGGSGSSLLAQEIREKRGLVYTVESFDDTYSDVGLFGIYAGMARENLDEFITATAQVLKEATRSITEAEVDKATRQIKNGALMSRESTHYRASKVSSDFLIHGQYVYPDETFSYLEGFTPTKASKLLSDVLTAEDMIPALALYGNIDESTDYIGLFKQVFNDA